MLRVRPIDQIPVQSRVELGLFGLVLCLLLLIPTCLFANDPFELRNKRFDPVETDTVTITITASETDTPVRDDGETSPPPLSNPSLRRPQAISPTPTANTTTNEPKPPSTNSRPGGIIESRESSGRHRYYFGVRYPGVSLGTRGNHFSSELKVLEKDDIFILGLRLYHHPFRYRQIELYWGTDLSAISFEGDVSRGEGISTGLVGGVEKFFGHRWSWKIDAGPYYTFIEDDETNLDEKGLDFVITTGLQVHFF